MASYNPYGTFGGGMSSTTGTGSTGGGFNINPGPQSGSGPFGAVPGAVGPVTAATVAQPPDPFGVLSKLDPNLGASNAGAGSFINSELQGQLSPGTINALTNLSASRGISSGMGPTAGLWSNALLGNVAGATEALQQHGVADQNAFTSSLAQNQTITPALQAQINEADAQLAQQAALANQAEAERNAAMKAAPNPAAAQSYAQQLFQKYMGAGGGGGNTWASQHHPAGTTYTGGGGFGSGAGFGGFGQTPDLTQGGYGPAYSNTGGWSGADSGGALGLSDSAAMTDPFASVMDPSAGMDFGGG